VWIQLLIIVLIAAAWVIFGLLRAEGPGCGTPEDCGDCSEAGRCSHFRMRGGH
jgi:hypothetical protein